MSYASRTITLLGLCFVASASPVAAHHSFAMFDDSKEVTLDATVKEYQWTNPHLWIEVMVPENGRLTQYSIEGGAPLVMGRKGWTRNSFKAGDKVKITVNPMKDPSQKGGSFLKAVFPDGHVISGRY